ncbi:carboxylesterase/lipase family protein [Streptomyces microflavus]|jgi:para-nitrobenzyl esterase|uniref:Carboxylic ester hydrolase n=2 Tax=Streptomyces microflavus TaxID=1919 RepID=A0A6N9VKX2_STRMI|nr:MULTISPECIES: carboxylesterase family protein [Streptomyces]AGK78258.1 Putative carboxylesterase [Streptomyces microflavus DSM 40593]MBW3359493.1 carboxylesterase family protein [Streptomyces sp. 09ZI22]MDX2403125.1 carboxylesterase family protein [Streptomyces microflavus]NEB72082.1 carboxylesterase family protein [Streptomyces microflavus]
MTSGNSSGLPRRTFVATAAAAAAAAATAGSIRPAAAASASHRPSRPRSGSVTVRTTAGRIAGQRLDDVTVFRGVPYAAPPVGPLRFASPRPPEPWNGVRDATAFGAPALQTDYLPDSSEDCLYANVWTPSTSGRRPVVVYIHGGGWFLGAGSEPDYDGARPAVRGDLVVINFNYRLGLLGWGLHEEFTDRRTSSFANWGLQDQAALLHWVQANAAAFGGDPGNITLAGTSAGGSSTWQLSLLPQLRGVIRRAVPISAKHVWNPASSTTPQESREVYALLASRLGTTVAGLRQVSGHELKAAWEELYSGDPAERPVTGWREYRGPVPDGQWMRGYDHELPTPRIPVMPVYARTEGSFFTAGPGYPYPGPHPTNDAELREAVFMVLRKGSARAGLRDADQVIAFYRKAAVRGGLPQDPMSLWTEIWGDGLFRYQIVRLAERHAREGRSPQYLMEFAHPVRAPYSGTPHEATSKFLFGSHALPVNEPAYGDGPLERQVSDTLIDLIASFARDGRPVSPHAPAWPEFSPRIPSTMVVGGPDVARVSTTFKADQLRYWDRAGWVPRT